MGSVQHSEEPWIARAWAAQTPRAFRWGRFGVRPCQGAGGRGLERQPDDAALFERLGLAVGVIAAFRLSNSSHHAIRSRVGLPLSPWPKREG